MRRLAFYSMLSLLIMRPVVAEEITTITLSRRCVEAVKDYMAQAPNWPLWSDAKEKLQALQRGEVVRLGDCAVVEEGTP